MHTIFLLEYLNGRDHLEDLGVDRKTTLERILGKYGGKVWTGCIWLMIGTTGGGSSEYSNEPLGCIKCGEFLD
jgi:hypothetical protein